jgi:cytochrome c1
MRPAVALLLAVLAGCKEGDAVADLRVVGGDPDAGRAAIHAVGCGVCHDIPGVSGAHGVVGPPLGHFAQRQFIAGTLPNRPGVLTRWVGDAPALLPSTAMPDLPIDEEQARDIAAYLYTLR